VFTWIGRATGHQLKNEVKIKQLNIDAFSFAQVYCSILIRHVLSFKCEPTLGMRWSPAAYFVAQVSNSDRFAEQISSSLLPTNRIKWTLFNMDCFRLRHTAILIANGCSVYFCLFPLLF
jgi:hypothetical protein